MFQFCDTHQEVPLIAIILSLDSEGYCDNGLTADSAILIKITLPIQSLIRLIEQEIWGEPNLFLENAQFNDDLLRLEMSHDPSKRFYNFQ